MSFSTRASVTEVGGILVSADTLGNTGSANVTGESSGSIFVIDIDNTNNTADVYLKVKDHASNVGPRQTPEWMFKGKAGGVPSYVFTTGSTYAAGVSIWCTSLATVADNTDPANSVRVDMVAS